MGLFLVLLLLLASLQAEDRIDITDEGIFEPGDPPIFHQTSPFATWVAYHNGKRIPETEFYRLLGDVDLAAEAEDWAKWKTGLGWGGLGVLATGIAVGALAALSPYTKTGDLPFAAIMGSVLVGGGLWTAWLALGFNFQPIDRAQAGAKAFNNAHK